MGMRRQNPNCPRSVAVTAAATPSAASPRAQPPCRRHLIPADVTVGTVRTTVVSLRVHVVQVLTVLSACVVWPCALKGPHLFKFLFPSRTPLRGQFSKSGLFHKQHLCRVRTPVFFRTCPHVLLSSAHMCVHHVCSAQMHVSMQLWRLHRRDALI